MKSNKRLGRRPGSFRWGEKKECRLPLRMTRSGIAGLKKQAIALGMTLTEYLERLGRLQEPIDVSHISPPETNR